MGNGHFGAYIVETPHLNGPHANTPLDYDNIIYHRERPVHTTFSTFATPLSGALPYNQASKDRTLGGYPRLTPNSTSCIISRKYETSSNSTHSSFLSSYAGASYSCPTSAATISSCGFPVNRNLCQSYNPYNRGIAEDFNLKYKGSYGRYQTSVGLTSGETGIPYTAGRITSILRPQSNPALLLHSSPSSKDNAVENEGPKIIDEQSFQNNNILPTIMSSLMLTPPACCDKYTSPSMVDMLKGTEAGKLIESVCGNGTFDGGVRPSPVDFNKNVSKGAQTSPPTWIFIDGGLKNGKFMPIGGDGKLLLPENGFETKESQTPPFSHGGGRFPNNKNNGDGGKVNGEGNPNGFGSRGNNDERGWNNRDGNRTGIHHGGDWGGYWDNPGGNDNDSPSGNGGNRNNEADGTAGGGNDNWGYNPADNNVNNGPDANGGNWNYGPFANGGNWNNDPDANGGNWNNDPDANRGNWDNGPDANGGNWNNNPDANRGNWDNDPDANGGNWNNDPDANRGNWDNGPDGNGVNMSNGPNDNGGNWNTEPDVNGENGNNGPYGNNGVVENNSNMPDLDGGVPDPTQSGGDSVPNPEPPKKITTTTVSNINTKGGNGGKNGNKKKPVKTPQQSQNKPPKKTKSKSERGSQTDTKETQPSNDIPGRKSWDAPDIPYGGGGTLLPTWSDGNISHADPQGSKKSPKQGNGSPKASDPTQGSKPKPITTSEHGRKNTDPTPGSKPATTSSSEHRKKNSDPGPSPRSKLRQIPPVLTVDRHSINKLKETLSRTSNGEPLGQRRQSDPLPESKSSIKLLKKKKRAKSVPELNLANLPLTPAISMKALTGGRRRSSDDEPQHPPPLKPIVAPSWYDIMSSTEDEEGSSSSSKKESQKNKVIHTVSKEKWPMPSKSSLKKKSTGVSKSANPGTSKASKSSTSGGPANKSDSKKKSIHFSGVPPTP